MAAMRTRITHILLTLVLLALLGLIGMVATRGEAGPLDPPNAPGSTGGVRLSGTPINQPASFPIVISQPGHYYLAENITGVSGQSGIEVASDNVDIDLNGFLLNGAVGSQDAITDAGVSLDGISVHGGTIISWGDDGIDLRASTEVRVHDIIARGNLGSGIEVGSGSVSNCTVAGLSTGLVGIRAQFRASMIDACTTRGYGTGIALDGGGTVRNCLTTDALTTGISAVGGASITGCHVRHVGSLAAGSQNVGIVVYGPALVEHNFVEDVIVSSGSFDGGVMFLGNGTVVRDNTFESAGSCSFIVIGDEASLFDNAVSEPTTTCFAANVVAVEIGPTEPADTSTSPSANIQH